MIIAFSANSVFSAVNYSGSPTGFYGNTCYAKNPTSFHRTDLLPRLNRGNARQDVFHADDDHAPHGPGIHSATLRTTTNRGKKVECRLFLAIKGSAVSPSVATLISKPRWLRTFSRLAVKATSSSTRSTLILDIDPPGKYQSPVGKM